MFKFSRCNNKFVSQFNIISKNSVFNRQKLLYSTSINTDDFPAAYVPSFVESGRCEAWKKNVSHKLDGEPELFTMLMPPPNITGVLHLGHVLTLTIQDVLIRWKQMCGVQTVWVPGMDHAGIATQVIVERKLWQEEKKRRHDLGRERFQEQVWRWKQEKSAAIEAQVRRIGALPDWERQYFTMDGAQSRAVVEAFIRLFDAGLIYRADYLVNWSCVLQSAISDVEVEHVDVPGSKYLHVPGYDEPVPFGTLASFAYKLSGTDEELVVSSTRPETMLGDVAVAVHPGDGRYTRHVGQQVVHPVTQQPLPIICDEFVDPDFGTGVVKVTPAHDPADFQVGKRHHLPLTQVIDERGLISLPGPFQNMKRFHARQKILEYLHQLGLLRGVVEHPMKVPVCSRSGDVVEYLVRPQWFVSCQTMAEKAAQHVRDGSLVIEPTIFHATWFNWLENIRDWCISRQLWWGHRVPAYRCRVRDSEDGISVWVAAENGQDAAQKASLKLNTKPELIVANQDEDVLDTWFSSALLPASVFGWPEHTANLRTMYPLSLMETGHDILFFWVARMVMLGLELTGRLPFNKVLLHGVICDAHGRKMSKSLGNVIAPEEIIEGRSIQELQEGVRAAHHAGLISEAELERALQAQRTMFPAGIPACGADALRFTLCSHNIKCHYINFDVSECHVNKLFGNKLWQACKYVRRAHERLGPGSGAATAPPPPGPMDRWVLSRLGCAVRDVNAALRRADLHVAAAALKHFLYAEYCDVYVETTKATLRRWLPEDMDKAIGQVDTLVQCLDVGLRLLLPFMPHLAPYLHKQLPAGAAPVTHYPQASDYRDERLERAVQMALDAVTTIRRLRKLHHVGAKHPATVVIATRRAEFTELQDVISTLSGCDAIRVTEDLPVIPNMGAISETISDYGTVHVFLPERDKWRTVEMQSERAAKKVEKLRAEIDKMRGMMGAEGYRTKAPPHVQHAHQAKLATLMGELERLRKLHTT